MAESSRHFSSGDLSISTAVVLDWLADFEEPLDPSQLKVLLLQNKVDEVTSSIFAVLGEPHRFPDLSFKICNQFHNFYKSGVTELRRFTLQFLPIIVYNYLNAVSQGDKRGSRHIETLLIAIYNIEISNDDDSHAKIISFRMPILAHASIYHEEKMLHQTDLRRWEENSNKRVNWGPLPQVEHLNAQNRLKVITALLFIYNQQLSQIQKPTLFHLCRIASQLVNQGFAKFERTHRSYGSSNEFHNSVVDASIPTSKALPRVPVSAEMLLELTHAAYFVMFNEFASVAIRTIKDIHRRACFEMLPSVILVTGAVKNSLHANPSGQPSDGPMGISVALTPATTTVTVSKSMITNASFRAKKLPDDIPIQLSKDDKGSSGTGGSSLGNPSGALNSSGLMDTSGQLQSIHEEGEAQDGAQLPTAAHLGRNTPGRQSKEFTAKLHKVSFPNFKKRNDKDSKSKSGSSASSGFAGTELQESQPLSSQSSSSSSAVAGPMKRASILKDKLINRNSVPSDTVDVSGGSSERVSLKMKNISLDSGTSSVGGGSSLVLVGGGGGSNNSFDLTESSSDPLENNSMATRPSILPLDLDKSSHSNGASGANNSNNNNVQVYQL